jgi:xanthine dehydrogenase accessory factor
MKNVRIVIKGAGDIATGIAHRLYMANMTKILMTEIPEPTTVRRAVAFSETMYNGHAEVEAVTAERLDGINKLEEVWNGGRIGVIVDPEWRVISLVKPDVVVDAIMAKKNLGTGKDEAPLVIGVGPGFDAPRDVHVVVESNRGHNLGRAIYKGSAEPFTGRPGTIDGYTAERVLRSPHSGMIKHVREIGDKVEKGQTVLYVDDTPVAAGVTGVVRGLIREIAVKADEKISDVDPRGIREYCYTISDKASAIGGGVLEAIMHGMNRG